MRWRSVAGAFGDAALLLRDTALESLLPALCPCCGGALPGSSPGGICRACWRSVARLGSSGCPVCDVPLPLDASLAPLESPDTVFGAPRRLRALGSACPDCRAAPPPFDALRAAGVYAGALKKIVKEFKFHDQPELARPLGALIAGRFFLEGDATPDDRVVFVPQRFLKRRRRGYNPAALLAGCVARETGVPVVAALRKVRWTPDQARIHSIPERARNIEGAFGVRARAAALLEGRDVLLVDDVVTTGATVREASRALRAAGAARVVVLAAARTPRLSLHRV